MRKRIKIKSAELVSSTDTRLNSVLSQLRHDKDAKLPIAKRNAMSFFSSIGKNYDQSKSVGEGTL